MNARYFQLSALAEVAPRNASFHVAPRYSGGSPALVDIHTCLSVAVDEEEAREMALTGVCGEEKRQRAATLGLEGVAYARWEKGGKVWRMDLLTGERFIVPKRLTHKERDETKALRNRKQFLGLNATDASRLNHLERVLALHREEV